MRYRKGLAPPQIPPKYKVVPLTCDVKDDILRTVDDLSEDGFRVIALAQKSDPAPVGVLGVEDEANMVLMGYLAFLDPPKESDEGISVDTAVDVAKESADIILLEKDLMVLEEGIIEGRKTYANMIKYIKMTASSNFGNMFSVVAAVVLVQNLVFWRVFKPFGK